MLGRSSTGFDDGVGAKPCWVRDGAGVVQLELEGELLGSTMAKLSWFDDGEHPLSTS